MLGCHILSLICKNVTNISNMHRIDSIINQKKRIQPLYLIELMFYGEIQFSLTLVYLINDEYITNTYQVGDQPYSIDSWMII